MSDDKHNVQGIPNGERSTDADTASGGAPDESGSKREQRTPRDRDPDADAEADGNPAEDPSGR